jgi:hypothetical protein
MESLAEAVGGRAPPVLRPEEVHGPLPVEVVPRREGEQLHQGGGLPESPRALLHGVGPHRDPEPAEQPNTQRFGPPNPGISRAFLGPTRSLRSHQPFRRVHPAVAVSLASLKLVAQIGPRQGFGALSVKQVWGNKNPRNP